MFPLPLTPFEEYMLLDSHPAYPMSCFLILRFTGKLDHDLFRRAVATALKCHPLLRSIVEKSSSGALQWVECEREPDIQFEDNKSAAPRGIDLFREPGLKIVIQHGDGPEGVVLRFEIHHTASDAAGIQRFIEDVFYEYAVARNFVARDPAREPVELDRLRKRGSFGLTFGKFLRILPRQIWGLERARTFLLHRIIPLVPQKPDLSCENPPPAFPALLHREWDRDETQEIRRRAKQEGITINDLALRAAFLALGDWQTRENVPKTRGFLRLAVPTNLRTPDDRLMPSANIVSMVFLDRKPDRIRNDRAFSQGIHREMEHIKRCNLGLALIHGLTIYRRLFGSYTKMIDRDRCWTTATVSNLGAFFSETPFPKRDGHIMIDDDLELVHIDSVPPIRPQSALGVCLLSYAGRMTVDMQYDTTLLDPGQAEGIFELLCDYLSQK